MAESNGNICKFKSASDLQSEIYVYNFVCEKNWHAETPRVSNSFLMCICTNGYAEYKTFRCVSKITPNTLFMIFPGDVYELHEGEGFEFLYLTFYGAGAGTAIEKLKISTEKPCETVDASLTEFWIDSLNRVNTKNFNIISKSVLYYTFSLFLREFPECSDVGQEYDIIRNVQEYINEHFRSPDLSLSQIADHFSYQANYLGHIFTLKTGTTILNYIKKLRLEQAAEMLSEGKNSVSFVSRACGFRDPQYFSKVFAKYYGKSPSNFR